MHRAAKMFRCEILGSPGLTQLQGEHGNTIRLQLQCTDYTGSVPPTVTIRVNSTTHCDTPHTVTV